MILHRGKILSLFQSDVEQTRRILRRPCRLPLIVTVFSLVAIGAGSASAETEKWPAPIPQDVVRGRPSEITRLLDEKKWAEAVIALQGVLKENPRDLPRVLDLARALTYLNRREEAVTAIQNAARTAARTARVTLGRRARVLAGFFLTNETFQIYQDGLTFLLAEKSRDAERLFTQALRKEPDNVRILTRMAQASMMEGSVDSAIEYLKNAGRLNPEEPEIRLWLGRAHFRRGELEAAIAHLQFAQTGLPRSELAPIWYAEALAADGNTAFALEMLKKDAKDQPLHLQSLVKSAELRVGSSATVKPDALWAARADLQVVLSRLGEYQNLPAAMFETDLGLPAQDAAKLKQRTEALLRDIETKIEILKTQKSV
ncbi:MAG: tetratricopeptide repeat protein [Bacteriovoracia bacterium]